MNRVIVLMLILSITNSVNAINEAFITIDNGESGLCLSPETLTQEYCQNDTFSLSGTQDHFIYIQQESKEINNMNGGSSIIYAVELVFGLVSTIGFFALLIVFFVALAYLATALFHAVS